MEEYWNKWRVASKTDLSTGIFFKNVWNTVTFYICCSWNQWVLQVGYGWILCSVVWVHQKSPRSCWQSGSFPAILFSKQPSICPETPPMLRIGRASQGKWAVAEEAAVMRGSKVKSLFCLTALHQQKREKEVILLDFPIITAAPQPVIQFPCKAISIFREEFSWHAWGRTRWGKTCPTNTFCELFQWIQSIEFITFTSASAICGKQLLVTFWVFIIECWALERWSNASWKHRLSL